MRGVVLLLSTCACKQLFGLGDPQPISPDAMVGDSAPITDGAAFADAQQCWAVPQVEISFCLTAPLNGQAIIGGTHVVNTDATGSGAFDCKPTSPAALCVIAADTITITAGSTLDGNGMRPLVLVANTITIDGKLDVASHLGGDRAPGAGGALCGIAQGATNRGGGAGGSFGGRGGNGGDQHSLPGTGGVAANAVASITKFQGGCAGAVGGGTIDPGAGGGAVALIAQTIQLGSTAVINASGAAGGAGSIDDGGSGAGSGGIIVFQAASLIATAGSQVFANGGGGGGAGGDTAPGLPGTDPPSALQGGLGGQAAGSDAGDGGDGYPAAAGARNGIVGEANLAGGGGGAGGAGVIRVYGGATLAGATVSPPSS